MTGNQEAAEWSRSQFRRACPRCGARRIDSQLGLEATPEEYVANLVAVFREVRRVLRRDGTVWLNLGDSYAGSGKGPEGNLGVGTVYRHLDGITKPYTAPGLKPKDLVGIPWRVAFALQADGWWLRSDIIWSKPNPMPESVTDRPTKAHEYLFLLAKSERYFYDAEAVKEPSVEPDRIRADKIGGASWLEREQHSEGGLFVGSVGRNRRSVWEIATEPMSYEACRSCRAVYSGSEYRRLRAGSAGRCTSQVAEAEECGSTEWLNAEGGITCASCGTHYSAASARRLPRAHRCHCGRDDAWVSHFATFPTELVKPCILAGTSEWGCCSVCGAPWRRVVEREFHSLNAVRINTTGQDFYNGWAGTTNGHNETRTTGWQPSCSHEAPVQPALVLDCFFGSGTVGLVAARAGRDWLGIELSPAYCEMAERRLAGVKARLL